MVNWLDPSKAAAVFPDRGRRLKMKHESDYFSNINSISYMGNF
jgi:hypothetical protein